VKPDIFILPKTGHFYFALTHSPSALDNSLKFATIKIYTGTIIRQKFIEKNYAKGGDMG